jgi:hypothetical protein
MSASDLLSLSQDFEVAQRELFAVVNCLIACWQSDVRVASFWGRAASAGGKVP